MAAFVSKSRRPKFELSIRIIDLNNVPLVSGSSFVKWHIPSSNSAEHRGRTQKCPIRDHRVQYEYDQQIPVRLVVGKDGMLQECNLVLEVLQEYSGSGRGERITLGNVKLNLSEYVEASEPTSPQSPVNAPGTDPTDGVVRRYLMQDSKINSTLKVGLFMRHVEGTKDYYAPPLKTAPVFGGIAGIISSSEPASTTHGVASHTGGDTARVDGIELPNLSASSREVGEMQDMYRRTLAAYWASQPGELKADECIEDIFAGGDGWGKNGPPRAVNRNDHHASGSSSPNLVGGDNKKEHGSRAGGSSGYNMHARNYSKYSQHKRSQHPPPPPRKAHGELDEFEVRNDLRSWTIGEKAMA
ncbi:hypothetical protein AMS68_001627 [Peltaster fructicola]|uniref:C2 NT-type domain-containing protein n=1 Tax=Peltaster fructicola TaxID=286661 RepID=A0A6H0XNP9_9PEZI|nr:hypothetical protein AMS68_001627 [Peltaster fructicola]